MMGEGAADGLAFPRHRSVTPMPWVLAGLSLVVAFVMHALVAHRRPHVALLPSLPNVARFLWRVRLVGSFRTLRVMGADGVLTMHVGVLRAVAIPVAQVAELRTSWASESLGAPGIVNLGLLAYPNIVVDEAPPLAGRRGRSGMAVAHRLDDPDASVRWIATLPPPHGLE